MKRIIFTALMLASASGDIPAGAPDPQTTFFTLGVDPATGLPIRRFDWVGSDGWTCFIQGSDDLVHWQYYPVIDNGPFHDPFDCEPDSTRYFLRLRMTDMPTSDPELADFDGDGISNIDEVTIYHTDPFDPDTDHDGIPDGVEIANGGNPLSNADGNPLLAADTDGDGISDAAEIMKGTSPILWDSDGDGYGDNEDAYPLDPSRHALSASGPGGGTGPVVTLESPANAVLVSGP